MDQTRLVRSMMGDVPAEPRPAPVASETAAEAPTRRPARTRLLVSLGIAGLLLSLVSILLIRLVIGAERRNVPAPESAARTEGGSARLTHGGLEVELPEGIPDSLLRITLLYYGEVAAATDGTRVERLTPRQLVALRLPAVLYSARMTYRGRELPARIADVEPYRTTRLEPPRPKLAAIEYGEGLRAVRRSSNADVEYFRRTVVLDPSHVEAHLQLAAYALVHRRYREVEEHLAAVRRVDRHTATVARIERILRQRR